MNILQSIGQNTLCELRECSSLDRLSGIVLKLAASLGADYFQFIPGPANPFEDTNCLFEIGNFSPDLREYYKVETNCLRDPCFIAALDNTSPIRWRAVFMECRSAIQREFVGFLRLKGLIDGISVPVHGPNGCSAVLIFASSRLIQKSFDDIDSLSVVAVAIMQRVKRILAADLIPKSNVGLLTQREIECLKWVLDGKTNWEIGILVGITARTVQFHLANCARKLGVNNRIQAAIRALLCGIIKLPDLKNSKPNNIIPQRSDELGLLLSSIGSLNKNGENQKSHF